MMQDSATRRYDIDWFLAGCNTCHLMLDGDDRLRLRGYIGIPLLGRTTTGSRVGAENRLCREESR